MPGTEKVIHIVFAAMIAVGVSFAAQAVEQVVSEEGLGQHRIYTGNLPPWSIQGGKGNLHAIVMEAEARLGSNIVPEFVPWSRALQWGQVKDNSLVFPVTRTPGREDKYLWIAEMTKMELVFASFDTGIETFDNARHLKAVGVIARAPSAGLLTNKGFGNLEKSHQGPALLVEWLKSGRIDAWFDARALIEFAFEDAGAYRPLSYSPAMGGGMMYVVGPKTLPRSLVKAYRDVLSGMRQDGSLERLLQGPKTEQGKGLEAN